MKNTKNEHLSSPKEHDGKTAASYSISESKMMTIFGKVKPSQVQSIYRSLSYFLSEKHLKHFYLVTYLYFLSVPFHYPRAKSLGKWITLYLRQTDHWGIILWTYWCQQPSLTFRMVTCLSIVIGTWICNICVSMHHIFIMLIYFDPCFSILGNWKPRCSKTLNEPIPWAVPYASLRLLGSWIWSEKENGKEKKIFFHFP